MRELQPGLWHWQAPHPDWRQSEPWDPNVSSYAIDDGESLLLFDPLGVPGEIEALAAEGKTAVVLTATHGVPFERADLGACSPSRNEVVGAIGNPF